MSSGPRPGLLACSQARISSRKASSAGVKLRSIRAAHLSPDRAPSACVADNPAVQPKQDTPLRSRTRLAAEPSPAARAVLEKTFGLNDFRPGQADVVAATEAGADVLFVAPTGSGKSIAYWVPGIAGGGLTLVVSPLIALMVDQVARLNQLSVRAECLHSQIPAAARAAITARAAAGELRFLYLAPERIGAPGFVDTLRRLDVGRFVVDEAHCISNWGHDFRPDYRRIGDAIAACGRPPVGAFTATATPRVRHDIASSLGLREPVERVTGFV
ncbi:MAG: DEAD/DEAH box helicase, partial [Chloroflexi bacterium]